MDVVDHYVQLRSQVFNAGVEHYHDEDWDYVLHGVQLCIINIVQYFILSFS